MRLIGPATLLYDIGGRLLLRALIYYCARDIFDALFAAALRYSHN